MAANLLQDAGSFLGPDTFGRLGEVIGESPETTSRAASATLPALLGGVSEIGRHEPGRVMGLIRSNHYDDDATMSRVDAMIHGLPDIALASEGSSILRSLFGGRLDSLVDGLSASTGVSRGKTWGLLAMLAPVVLGVVGKKVHDERLDTNGLARLLDGQAPFLRKLVPDGVARTLGFGRPTVVHTATLPGAVPLGEGGVRTMRIGETERRRGAPAWLWFLVGLAALVLIAVLLFRALGGARSPEVIDGPEVGAAGTDGKPSEAMGGAVSLGTERGAERDATERAIQTGPALAGPAEPGVAGLRRALEDDTEMPARFTIDDLRFDVGSSDLGEEPPSITLITDAPQAYPMARVRIEGHTDSSGDPESNRELSQQRASAVRDAIIARGVEVHRVEAEGYGSERPIADDSTDAGRARNRRTEVVLIAR